MALPGPVPDSELPDWAKARDKNEKTTSQVRSYICNLGKLHPFGCLEKCNTMPFLEESCTRVPNAHVISFALSIAWVKIHKHRLFFGKSSYNESRYCYCQMRMNRWNTKC